MPVKPHILIVGGGYVGMYTAYRLQKMLRKGEADITVVEPQNHMTYQPFLPEAAAGAIEPRHVVVPLRRVLRKCRVLTGAVESIEHARHTAIVRPAEGPPQEVKYDILVMAAGSVARTLPIAGLAEHGIGFKNIGEAIYLRNHVLSRMDFAASTDDQELRRRALTFVFIGGGYAGIEAFAELEDMSRYALRYYDHALSAKDMRWVLIEAADRILPEVSKSMAAYTVQRLIERGMDIRLNTRVTSLEDGYVVLDDGEKFAAETVVWTAGVKANPLLQHTDLPIDDRQRLKCTAELQVEGLTDAWGAGDAAAVPDLTKPGAFTAPSAQHAVRQAKTLAENITAALRGKKLKKYSHKYAGSVASLGLHKGVAEIYGVKLRGFLAWFMHRSYHVSRMPTFNRKVRIIADWTLSLFFRREVVALGQLQNPRRDFEAAARPRSVPPRPEN